MQKQLGNLRYVVDCTMIDDDEELNEIMEYYEAGQDAQLCFELDNTDFWENYPNTYAQLKQGIPEEYRNDFWIHFWW